MDTASRSRTLWQRFEPLHAVVYFAPEVRDAATAVGLKGFWMGYFAGRAAPFGPVPPEVVAATFFNFRPSMVHRALPDAWALASPADILATRLDGVDRALRRLLGDDVADGPAVAEAAVLAERAAAACPVEGRALFAAHVALPWPEPAHLRLWHAATLLREHRGDSHVAALVAEGISGLDAHVLVAAAGGVPRTMLQPARGWTDDEWDVAEQHLADAGLVADGTLTPEGVALRDAIEETTDRLADAPWDHLGAAGTDRLAELLHPLAAAVTASGEMPFPNPIGLPAT